MATLPVLPLTDAVLLPGMVIPVTLDPTTQAAVDAARATGDKKLLAVPRIDGEYGSVGTVAMIEKVGRLPDGEPAAVVRGLSRARIGSGVPGPGAALWVEATELDEPAPAGKARELAREYRALMTSVLQQRGAWQVIDAMERMTDLSELADAAGYAPWLSLAQKTELLAAPDVTARLEAPRRLGEGPPRRAGGHRADQQRRPRGAGEVPTRVPAPPAARRDPQGASARTSRTAPPTTAAGWSPPTCRRRSARRPCARSASWSGPATPPRRPAGSVPGSTRSSRCRGTRVPTTTPTWPRPARCSTPTTPAWPT